MTRTSPEDAHEVFPTEAAGGRPGGDRLRDRPPRRGVLGGQGESIDVIVRAGEIVVNRLHA